MSQSPADLNLLYGFLALQNDYLSHEELLNALAEWLRDKSRALADILRERRILTDDQHRAVQQLLRMHLDHNDGDTEKILASLSSIGSLHERLTVLADPDITRSVNL